MVRTATAWKRKVFSILESELNNYFGCLAKTKMAKSLKIRCTKFHKKQRINNCRQINISGADIVLFHWWYYKRTFKRHLTT